MTLGAIITIIRRDGRKTFFKLGLGSDMDPWLPMDIDK
jgi:hypothetical protein